MIVHLVCPDRMGHKQQKVPIDNAQRYPAELALLDLTLVVSEKGSANARIATSKLMPCLRKLSAALTGSHSKRCAIQKCYYTYVFLTTPD